jgi:hypothetical protein
MEAKLGRWSLVVGRRLRCAGALSVRKGTNVDLVGEAAGSNGNEIGLTAIRASKCLCELPITWDTPGRPASSCGERCA